LILLAIPPLIEPFDSLETDSSSTTLNKIDTESRLQCPDDQVKPLFAFKKSEFRFRLLGFFIYVFKIYPPLFFNVDFFVSTFIAFAGS